VRNAHKILVRISEGERSLGRRRLKWRNSIKIDGFIWLRIETGAMPL
jgi:hypothetical protein